MEHTDKAKPKEELTDFRPDRISLVDEGAVGDPFMVIKSKDVEETKLPFKVRRLAKSHLDNLYSRITFVTKSISDVTIDETVSDVSASIAGEIFKIRDELLSLLDRNITITKSVVADAASWTAIEKSVLSTNLRDSITKILVGVSEKVVGLSATIDDDSTDSLERLSYGIYQISYDLSSLSDIAYSMRRLSANYLENDDVSKSKAVADDEQIDDNIEKAGAKISTSRLKKLQGLTEQVQTLQLSIDSIAKEMTGFLSEVTSEPVSITKGKTMGEEIKETVETPQAPTPDTVVAKIADVAEPVKTNEDLVAEVSESVVAKMRESFAETLAALQKNNDKTTAKLDEISKRLEKLEAAPTHPHSGDPEVPVVKDKTASINVWKGLFTIGQKAGE